MAGKRSVNHDAGAVAAPTARQLLRDLKARANPERALVSKRFFKTGPGQYGEGDQFLGLPVPMLRMLARQHAALPLAEAEVLLQSPLHEARLLALLILVHQCHRADAVRQRAIHDLYLRSTAYINNWDLVDTSAEHLLGAYLFTRSRNRLVKLARSPSIWERRIAIMTTFHFIRQGEFDETLRIATLLLDDTHDLIHKAVGWMLREIGKRDQAVEEAFLQQHAAHMPRTMLRYAIERFAPALRLRYMQMA